MGTCSICFHGEDYQCFLLEKENVLLRTLLSQVKKIIPNFQIFLTVVGVLTGISLLR